MIALLIMLAILAAGCVAGMIYSMWALHCNEVTYRQRQKIIKAASKQRDLSEAFDRVEYDDHMHELMCFRDPHKLYPDDLKGAF